jgi:hypothetical protein
MRYGGLQRRVCQSNNGVGVRAVGGGYGLYASTGSTGTGVYGQITGAANTGYAGYFTNTATTANYGVYSTTASKGAGFGHYSSITGAANTGCAGYFTNTATTGVNYGIYASAASTNASAYAGYFSGNIYVTGTITMTSDRRAKKNIEAIPEMHWMESRRYGRSHSHGKRTACPTWDLLPRRWTMFTPILSSTAATKRWR